MNKKPRFYFLNLLLLVVTTVFFGCVKTYKLVPSESPQGKTREVKKEIAENNLRSARVYHQWETDAIFDVLWMSDETRLGYTDLYCVKRGLSDASRKAMKEKQLNLNKENITFFVLADIRDRFHPKLSEDDPAWTIYLEAEGKERLIPEKIQEVDLDSEVLAFFGSRCRKPRFKTAYLVTFPAYGADGTLYISPTKSFKMMISSVSRECVLGWQGAKSVLVRNVGKSCNKKRKLIKDEDYYWI